MNERTFRPANVAAAAVLLGGALILVLPQHVLSIVRLVIATIAVAAGLHALIVNAPPAWWRSPFDVTLRRGSRRRAPDQLDWIRSSLSGRRQRIDHGASLPPPTLRLLQPLIRSALERAGFDPADGASLKPARALVAPQTLAVLRTEPLARPGRFRMLRADRAHTVAVVEDVLNDLDRLAGGGDSTPARRVP